MGKWLAAIGVLILVVLVLLWRQLDEPSAAAPAEAAKAAAPVQVASAPVPGDVKPVASATSDAVPTAVTAPASEEKMHPSSEEFTRKHDEVVVPRMMMQAVKCWENLPASKRAEFHRNQSMVATFKQKIRNGVVTIHDLKLERSSINDPALEACFMQQMAGTTWTNPRLPDWDQDDQIKLGPRTLKKYTRENIEYEPPDKPTDEVSYDPSRDPSREPSREEK